MEKLPAGGAVDLRTDLQPPVVLFFRSGGDENAVFSKAGFFCDGEPDAAVNAAAVVPPALRAEIVGTDGEEVRLAVVEQVGDFDGDGGLGALASGNADIV